VERNSSSRKKREWMKKKYLDTVCGKAQWKTGREKTHTKGGEYV